MTANTNKYTRQQDAIIAKIIIQADIKLDSPLLIGKGSGEESDLDVMLLDGKPYIPASSFNGAIKHFFDNYADGIDEELQAYIWGDKENNQSHLIFEDLLTIDNNAKIVVRDGVKINYKTNIADNGAKYDYQLLEPGIIFKLRAEITGRKNVDVNSLKNVVQCIYEIIQQDTFRIGAYSNHGFGKISCTDFNTYLFDFSSKEKNDADAWFNYIDKLNTHDTRNETYYKVVPSVTKIEFNSETTFLSPINTFGIAADFKIKSSLIIGDTRNADSNSDKMHLKSNNKNILPAKSIRGVLRQRAERINKITKFNNIQSLFGNVDEKTKAANKGKLLIEEEPEITAVSEKIQTRIKIDRFTGGTINSALFSSTPLWNDKNEPSFTLLLKITNANQFDKILLLNLLKDLFTEDLAIGGEKNAGRGILQGISAKIIDNGTEIIIKENGLVENENVKLFNVKNDCQPINV